MMRHYYILILFLAVLYCCSNKHSSDKSDKHYSDTVHAINSDTIEWHSAVGKQYNGLTFAHDSGFVLKKDGLRFLLSLSLTDTVSSFWYQSKDNDTIGKYYKVNASGNYFVCLIDLSSKFTFGTHLLLEIKNDGTVLKSERYFHGNYSCCWNNYYEGFFKTGNYFAMTTCGTGSGFCGSYIYIFKEIKPQEFNNSITVNYWSSFSREENLSLSLNSTIEWKDGDLIMHYKLEKGGFDKNYTKFFVKSTDKFDVKYILQKGTWVPTDSTKKNIIEF